MCMIQISVIHYYEMNLEAFQRQTLDVYYTTFIDSVNYILLLQTPSNSI